jgi:hypothetical protein
MAHGFAYTAFTKGNFYKKNLFWNARVAQLVEQRIENPRVTGSIPVSGTIFSTIKSYSFIGFVMARNSVIFLPASFGMFWVAYSVEHSGQYSN